MQSRIIIGLTEWNLTGPCVFGERLARGLTALGSDVRILLTEMNRAHTCLEATPRAMPDDLVYEYLPVSIYDGWGVRWEALIRYLEERAPCIFITNRDWRNSVVVPRLSDRIGVIGVIHVDHDLEYNQIARMGYFFNALVAVTDPIHFNAAHQFPYLASRMVTIPNATPSLTQMPEKAIDGPLRICYSGEIRHAQKRLDDLVRIAYSLNAGNVDFELTFLGDGPMRTDLEKQCELLVTQRKVRFPGQLPLDQLLGELKRYDVFVLTSEYEGLSIALLEAMSRGCVPVVSNLPTQSQVIKDGVNSYCVPVGDIDGFVKRLTTLWKDPVKRKQMGEAAFQTIVNGRYRIEDMLNSYTALFAKIEEMVKSKRFVRAHDWLSPPPASVGDISILSLEDPDRQTSIVNHNLLWPNPALTPDAGRASQYNRSIRTPARSGDYKKEEYKLIAAIPGGKISGVDIFTCHLIRQLRRQGMEAKVIGGRLRQDEQGLPLADDIPVEELPVPYDVAWPVRWDAMIDYLETQAPCIYIPNYDYSHSGVCPRLSNRVKVVNIVHCDDPTYYEHALRLGKFSNALVGVSKAIVEYLAGLDPTLVPRLYHIPYGVDLQSPVLRASNINAPLRIIYVGQLVSHQKRIGDLIDIANQLVKRSIPFELTIVGNGPDYGYICSAGKQLIAQRRISLTGTLKNHEVLERLRSNDVFLLPSAFEGLSVSMLEAMANGVVPVVSNVRSGVPDIIRNKINGMIAPVGDIDQFADHLAYLYANPQQRIAIANKAYETVHAGGYVLDDMLARYTLLFDDVVNQPFVRPYGPILPSDPSQMAWQVQMPHIFKKNVGSVRRLLGRFKRKIKSKVYTKIV